MNHEESVERWLGVSFATLPTALQLAALERGFAALWLRARGTLGDVTLGAIGERVLAHAQDRFPFLAAATLTRDGLRCTEVKAPSSEVVEAAARYLLVELLMILGRLTAEILTPALHDELENTAKAPTARKKSRPTKAAKAPKAATAPKPSTTSQTKRDRAAKSKKRASPRGVSS